MAYRWDLNNEETRTSIKKAVRAICSKKFKHLDPEDMFQSICVKILEKPHTSADIGFIFVDVLRDIYGRKADKNGETYRSYEGKKAVVHGVSYEDSLKKTAAKDDYSQIDMKLDVEKMMMVVDDEQVAQIIELVYYRGWKKCEVAEVLNVTPSYVSLKEKWAFEDIVEAFSA